MKSILFLSTSKFALFKSHDKCTVVFLIIHFMHVGNTHPENPHVIRSLDITHASRNLTN